MSYENELRVIAKMRADGNHEGSLSWKAAEEIKGLKKQLSEAKIAADIECPFCSSMDGPDTRDCYCGGTKKAVNAAMELFVVLKKYEENAKDTGLSPSGRLIQVCKNAGFSTLEASEMVHAAAEQRAAQAERDAVRECERIATEVYDPGEREMNPYDKGWGDAIDEVKELIRNRYPQHFGGE